MSAPPAQGRRSQKRRQQRRALHRGRVGRWFEQLESRSLLACMVTRSDDMLTITGDEQDNVLEVVWSAEHVRVDCDGETFFPSSSGVSRLSIETRGGNDRLGFVADGEDVTIGQFSADTGPGNDVVRIQTDFDAELPSLDFSADVNTGDGDDRVVYDYFWQRIIPGPVALTSRLNTGDGNDTVEMGIDENGNSVAFDSIVDTGRGNDIVGVDFGEYEQGSAIMVVRTGDDADRVVVNGTVDGNLDLSVLPGAGDNFIRVDVTNLDDSVRALWTSHDPLMAEASADAAPAELDVMFQPFNDGDPIVQFDLLGSRGRDDVRLDLNAPPGAVTDLDVTVNLRDGDDRLACGCDGTTYGNLDLSVLPGSGDNEVQIDLMLGDSVKGGVVMINALWTSHDPPLAEASADAAPAELDVMFRPDDNESTSGKVKLLGSRGRDELRLDLRTPPQSLDMDVDIDLRGGDDRADVGWRMLWGQLPPDRAPEINAVVNIQGGRGNDTIRADLSLAPAQGSLSVLLGGGDGNDRLALRRRGQFHEWMEKMEIEGLIDGGPGRDRCRASKGVEVINCEG